MYFRHVFVIQLWNLLGNNAVQSLLGRQSASTDTIRASTSRLLPAHLVFDVTKTQVASGQRKDRARVPKPKEPTRGFKNTSGLRVL